jgi:hypothetical protein
MQKPYAAVFIHGLAKKPAPNKLKEIWLWGSIAPGCSDNLAVMISILRCRVSSIVWLDAFIPKNGESQLDQISPFSRKALEEAMARGEAGRKPPKPSQYAFSEKDYAWMDSKLTPQPNSIVRDAIKLTGAMKKVAKKTFIRAPKYPQKMFDRVYEECKADPSWTTYVTDNSHHDIMIDQPEWLAGIMLKHS